MVKDDLYPLLIYEYDLQGRYGPSVRVKNAVELMRWLRDHLRKIVREKRELRITDTGDLMVLHIQNGKLLYDGVEHYPEGKVLPDEYLPEEEGIG